jgi:hypothetical protein
MHGAADTGTPIDGRELPVMSFQVSALDPEPFRHLFGRDDAALATLGATASTAEQSPGYPCRISLRDAAAGERVILLNYEHLPGNTPYRSRHAIFIRDGAVRATPAVDELPEYLSRRLLSIRAFDEQLRIVDADITDGSQARATIGRLLARPRAAFLHAHNAKFGCYLARVDRV